MDDNMELWDKVKRPQKEYLKPISGGRLKGKSDINPQWRFKIITECFGVCGIGWKYTIDRLWTENGSNDSGEIMAFALVSVYLHCDSGWSEPIPGIGGSKLIMLEKEGLYNSDEAYKMAVTDALSVAFKALGVAAEIYFGNWDGSKYKDTQSEIPTNRERAPEKSDHPTAKEECSRLSEALKLSENDKKELWDASSRNYSNLLIMLKEKEKEAIDKLALIDKTLSDVWDASKSGR